MKTITTTLLLFCFLIASCGKAQGVYSVPQARIETTVTPEEQVAGMCIEPDFTVPKCEMPDTSVEDQEMIERAVEMCYPDSKSVPTEYYINASKLLKVEHEMGVPDKMRGVTLASACVESGFNSKAEGDHKFSKDGKTPMAIGILQMWPCFERAYGTNRRDVESSAKGWLTNVKRQIPAVKRTCNAKTTDDVWRLALVHGIRAPKKGGRCNENTLHWYVFKKFRNYHRKQS